MKIGILGGSFNPAHQGHIYISELAIKKLGLNQVWWVPTAQNPLKEKTATPYKERLERCKQIIKNHPKIRVKDFEKDSFFTYNLVKKLKSQYPHINFYFVAGSDILTQFHKWKNYKILPKIIKFAIFSRDSEYSAEPCSSKLSRPIPKEFLVFNTKKYDLSSSAIRAKFN
jgi:nicotinate-nucleotide adenylyltransferase